MSWRLTLFATLAGTLGAGLAHLGQVRADGVRRGSDVGQEMLFAPRGDVLRVVSLDHHMLTSDLLWIRSVLEFGTRWGEDHDPRWAEWFTRNIRAITDLDPHWRSPYVYGGIMLKVVGATEASTEIFTLGSERLPNDFYLPFAVGMNYYVEGGEGSHEEAARWLQLASERPGAPPWYAVAAVAFREQKHERQQAIQFLREEIEATADPQLRAQLEKRLNTLVHEELEARFQEVVDRYTQRFGAGPKTPEALVRAGLMKELPVDPLGGTWVVDVDGAVRSSVDAELRAARDLKFERAMLTSRR